MNECNPENFEYSTTFNILTKDINNILSHYNIKYYYFNILNISLLNIKVGLSAIPSINKSKIEYISAIDNDN